MKTTNLILILGVLILIIILIGLINFVSIIPFFFFLFLGSVFFFILDKVELKLYFTGFLINSLLASLFIILQSYIYPDSYGTTSPLGSWTDDSYFFALCADTIPQNMFLRDNFWEYTHFYTDIIKFLDPFPINYPIDAIFFQSIIAAILAVYSKIFTFQITKNNKASKLVFFLCAFSPFLLMHGGAILLRDTLVASLIVFTLANFERERYLIGLFAITLQFPIRAGTAMIFLIFCAIYYYPKLKVFAKKGNLIIILGGISFLTISIFVLSIVRGFNFEEYFIQKGVSLVGREVFENLKEENNANQIFLLIQNQNFILKALLSAFYIIFYPFLNFKGIFNANGIDTRTFLLNIVYPIEQLFLNTYFFSAFLTLKKEFRPLLLSFSIGFILLGLFSLQTRHKTIFLPIFYVIVAIGVTYSSRNTKIIGASIASFWLILQFLIAIR
jgi:hypothetical protein